MNYDPEKENEINNKLGGHPKGTTVANSLDEKRKTEEAGADAVEQYRQAMLKSKNHKEGYRKKNLPVLFPSASRSMT